MVFISHLIAQFNKHFKYINEHGKRKGPQLFPNVDLTNKLVQLAIDLRRDVDTLLEGTNVVGVIIDFPAKADQFITLVSTAYELSLAYRSETGTKPAKFEKQLLSGLKGIIKEYTNVLAAFNIGVDFDKIDSKYTGLSNNLRLYLSFREKCEALIEKISTGNKNFDVSHDIQLPTLN